MPHPHLRSFSAIAIAALVVSSFSSVLLFPTKARASGCTITTSETIDASYMSAHSSCLDGIDISNNVAIVWGVSPLVLNSGATVVVSGGINSFKNVLNFDSANHNNFTVSNGATVMQVAEDFQGVVVLNADTIDVEGTINVSGGTLNGVTSGGCQPTSNWTVANMGKGPSGGFSCVVGDAGGAYQDRWMGGAHCGEGGTNGHDGYPQRNVHTYETSSTAMLPGSSGGGWSIEGYDYYGGAGGGVIKLTAASITINGTLTAKGADSPYDGGNGAGGGSGGTINIDSSGSISGTGHIIVDGGAGGGWGTGGGAGYIRVYYVDSLSTTLQSNMSATGGLGAYGSSSQDDGGSCDPYILQNLSMVPEFTPWILAATILAGFGLAYKLMPQMKTRTVK